MIYSVTIIFKDFGYSNKNEFIDVFLIYRMYMEPYGIRFARIFNIILNALDPNMFYYFVLTPH